jgi:hypothetical protein
MRRALTPVLIGLLSMSTSAFAQDVPRDPQDATRGPMLVEQVSNGFVIAPEYRITDLHGSVGHLAGAYGGLVIDNTLLIGGGGYGLTNDTSNVRSMGYGGVVVDWLQHANRPIGFSLRGLTGFGGATVTEQVFVPVPRFDRGDRFRPPPVGTQLVTVHSGRDFFVFEPQGSALFNFSQSMRLNVGVGYRLIAGAGSANDLLRGVSGNIAFEFGGSSTRTVSKP